VYVSNESESIEKEESRWTGETITPSDALYSSLDLFGAFSLHLTVRYWQAASLFISVINLNLSVKAEVKVEEEEEEEEEG